MEYELVYLGTCNSQYFGGYHSPVVQVMVDGCSTVGDVRDQLLDIYTATDHIEELDVEAYEKAVLEYFTDLFITNKNKFPDSSVEEMMDAFWNINLEIPEDDEEDEWDVYSFFGLKTIGE